MSSKPQAILEHMPFHIKKNIAAAVSNVWDRASLRKVSKTFRSLVDSTQNFPLPMVFFCDLDNIQLGSGSQTIQYTNSRDGCLVKCYSGNVVVSEKLIPRRYFTEQAAADYASYLLNPRQNVKDLSISFAKGFTDTDDTTVAKVHAFFCTLGISLSQLKQQMGVEKLEMHFFGSPDHVMSVLPYINPETLKVVALTDKLSPRTPIDISSIMCSEAFKTPKEVVFLHLTPTAFPVNETTLEFKQFAVYADPTISFSGSEFENILKMFNSSEKTEIWQIRAKFEELFLLNIFQENFEWDFEEESGIYKVPSSNTTVRFRFGDDKHIIDFVKL